MHMFQDSMRLTP